MNIQQDPHEAEVRRIAEVLADDFIDKWDDDGFYKDIDHRNNLIESFKDAARTMVAEMESKIRICMAPNHSEGYITNWLITLGIIPSPTKTAE